MRILYVARHGSGDNDDEGAISYALRKLGHTVLEVPEAHGGIASATGIDLLLFHKWYDYGAVARSDARVKAFWHFDLVTSDDWELKNRDAERVEWMSRITPLVDLGFCTDGDWVASDTTGKLRWLTQGMDERVAGIADPPPNGQDVEILFTGTTIHGGRRMSHVRELVRRYGRRFKVIGDRTKKRYHGRELAAVFARAKVVIAPDGPVTDRYWSNRVYNTLGLGGFLLHPACEGLSTQYAPGELIRYADREHLNELIDFYLHRPADRDARRKWGYEATVTRHLYRHRCEELVREVGKLL